MIFYNIDIILPTCKIRTFLLIFSKPIALFIQESVTFEVGSKEVLESIGIKDYSKFPITTYDVTFGDPTKVPKEGKR